MATETSVSFSGKRAAEIVGITYRQLDYWARTDLIRPSLADAKGSGSRRQYAYADLLELRIIKQLLDAGHQARERCARVRRAAAARRRRHRRGQPRDRRLVGRPGPRRRRAARPGEEGPGRAQRDEPRAVPGRPRRPHREDRRRRRAIGADASVGPTAVTLEAAQTRRRYGRAGRDRRPRAPRRSTTATGPSGPSSPSSAAGTCRCRTRRAPSPSTRPAAPAPWCSTSATSARCASRGPTPSTGCRPALHQRPGPDRARPGPVHPPARSGRRLGARRHHRVVGRRPSASTSCRTRRTPPGCAMPSGWGRRPTSPRTRAMLAVQGPRPANGWRRSARTSRPWGGSASPRSTGSGVPLVVAGTGYTGEDGVEIAVPADRGRRALGCDLAGAGIEPAGLGARDTLRLEAGLPLHGHELGPGITPLQAGLGWVVRWDKGDFRGREAARRREGARRRPPAPRHRHRGPPPTPVGDQPVLIDGEPVGRVTSGNFSPTLGHGIALGVPPARCRGRRAGRGRGPRGSDPRRHVVRPLRQAGLSGFELVRLDRGAGADEVAVAVAAVDAAYRRPVLLPPQRGHRVRGLLPGVRLLPVLGEEASPRCAARCWSTSGHSSVSARMAIIASQNRSSSARDSDSVGSTISVPATGKLIVGAWNP